MGWVWERVGGGIQVVWLGWARVVLGLVQGGSWVG